MHRDPEIIKLLEFLFSISTDFWEIFEHLNYECAKLVSPVPWRSTYPTSLRALRAHVPSCLRAFVPLLVTCLPFFTCLTCLHFLRALCAFTFF